MIGKQFGQALYFAMPTSNVWDADAATVAFYLYACRLINTRGTTIAGLIHGSIFTRFDWRTRRRALIDLSNRGLIVGSDSSYLEHECFYLKADDKRITSLHHEDIGNVEVMNVLDDPLTRVYDGEQLSYMEIKFLSYLMAEQGIVCRETNSLIASELDIAEKTVTRTIQSLAKKGLLSSDEYGVTRTARQRGTRKLKRAVSERRIARSPSIRELRVLDPANPGHPIVFPEKFRINGKYWADWTRRIDLHECREVFRLIMAKFGMEFYVTHREGGTWGAHSLIDHRDSYTFDDKTLHWLSARRRKGQHGHRGSIENMAARHGYSLNDFYRLVDESIKTVLAQRSTPQLDTPQPQAAATAADYSGAGDI
jgi:hypothetical protein